jgi:hypothetical protein
MHEDGVHNPGGFAGPWLALSFAFALHVVDEAATGFLNVYNPTVAFLRQRWGMPFLRTFTTEEFLVVMIVALALCFALTPFATRNAGWMRPLAWIVAVIQFSNAMGHTIGTVVGHTVATVTFPRPAPGFYSSPLLFAGSVWLMTRLWRTSAKRSQPAPVSTTA